MDTVSRHCFRRDLSRVGESLDRHGSCCQNCLNAIGSKLTLLLAVPAGHHIIYIHLLLEDSSCIGIFLSATKVVCQLFNGGLALASRGFHPIDESHHAHHLSLAALLQSLFPEVFLVLVVSWLQLCAVVGHGDVC